MPPATDLTVSFAFRLDAPRCGHLPQEDGEGEPPPAPPPGLETVTAESESAKVPMQIFANSFLAGDKQLQRPNMLVLTYRCPRCSQVEIQSVTWAVE